MLRDIIGQRQDLADNGKPLRAKSAVAAFESVAPSLSGAIPDEIPSRQLGAEANHVKGDIVLKGTIRCAGDLIIDCEVEGEVIVAGHLSIGKNARISGDVQARSAIIHGQIVGNVHAAERCELRSSAEVNGDIGAHSLSIEEGASFLGRSAVGASWESAESPQG